jgi:hypothetical protein
MSRWVIMLVLTVASATASAQPAQPPATTTKPQTDTRSLEKRIGLLATQRNQLAQKFEDETKAIDRLKQQRPSWRRDRELRDNLADANETATQLGAVTKELAKAQSALAAARRVLIATVDAELAAGATGARGKELAQLRAQLAPPSPARPVHRIVLPDMAVDPLADPEELDQQAAAFREVEAELSRQVIGLDKQAKDLDEVAKLRKAHERADVLARRDDDQPHRNATASTSRGAASALEDNGTAPTPGGNSGPPDPSASIPPSGPPVPLYETEARTALAGVIDASTIDSLARAQRSGDPAQRAAAAKKTRDAVAARLDQLKKKRSEIETAAKQRRLKR